MTHSDAYEDVREAAKNGAKPTDCPHGIGTKEAKDWLQGLHDTLKERS